MRRVAHHVAQHRKPRPLGAAGPCCKRASGHNYWPAHRYRPRRSAANCNYSSPKSRCDLCCIANDKPARGGRGKGIWADEGDATKTTEDMSGIHSETVFDHALPVRGSSQLIIFLCGSRTDRIRSVTLLAKVLACSSVCRLSFGSDIHSRMIFRRSSCSGFIFHILFPDGGRSVDSIMSSWDTPLHSQLNRRAVRESRVSANLAQWTGDEKTPATLRISPLGCQKKSRPSRPRPSVVFPDIGSAGTRLLRLMACCGLLAVISEWESIAARNRR
jgi:hypothetical protein